MSRYATDLGVSVGNKNTLILHGSHNHGVFINIVDGLCSFFCILVSFLRSMFISLSSLILSKWQIVLLLVNRYVGSCSKITKNTHHNAQAMLK